MTGQFTLYGSPNSQFAYKVALMLSLSGQPFSFRYVNFRTKMNEAEWFREMSRWSQVPVLDHDGEILVQSPAILEYLADHLGTFGGTTPKHRRHVREWLYWNTDRMAWPVNASWGIHLGERKYLPISVEPEIAAYIRARTERVLADFDRHVPDEGFLTGPSPTIADLCCYGEIPYARLCDYAMATRPRIEAWCRRIEALPGFRQPFDLLPLDDTEVVPD